MGPIESARYRPTLRDWRKATIRKRVTKKLSICLRLTRLRGIPYIAVPNAWALSSAGERSLHTGEVVGSIPTAPTILRDFLGSIRQLTTERNEKTTLRPGENRGTLFALCFIKI